MSDSKVFSLDKTTRGLELVSLAAIFPDEFEYGGNEEVEGEDASDYRKFKLRVRAENEPEKSFAEVDLLVGLGPRYPEELDSLRLQVTRGKGMDDEQVQELEAMLRELAKSLIGREMVFELAQAAQEYLRKHNIDPRRSIHDEMLEQERQQKEAQRLEEEKARREKDQMALEMKQQQRSRMMAEAEAEMRKRKELYKKKTKSKKMNRLAGELWSGSEEEEAQSADEWCADESATSSERQDSSEHKSSSDDTGDPPKPFRWRKFETAQRSESGEFILVPEVIGVGRFGVVYKAMAESNFTEGKLKVGTVFAIKEFTLKKGALRDEQIAKIMQEIDCHRQLDHPNIVKVFGADSDSLVFRVFLEYMPMGSIAGLLRIMGCLEEEVVRLFAKQLVGGLCYLHENHIVHRDIKPANLLLGMNGLLKISDFSEAKWLPNVIEDMSANKMLQSMRGTSRYMAPEVIRRRYTYAADVWSVGCSVLEMLTGNIPFSSFSTDIAVMRNVVKNEDPPNIPSDLTDLCQDFILSCFVRDPNKRPSAAELEKHSFLSVGGLSSSNLRNSLRVDAKLLQVVPHQADHLQLLTVDAQKEAAGKAELPIPAHAVQNPISSLATHALSRYRQEFEEVKQLGKGGFGEVWMCRNRLDGQCYAIKKIQLDSSNETLNRKMLREVKTLSGLHHQSIVRYYQAWIESRQGECGIEEDREFSDSSTRSSSSQGSDLVEDSIFDAQFLADIKLKSLQGDRAHAAQGRAAASREGVQASWSDGYTESESLEESEAVEEKNASKSQAPRPASSKQLLEVQVLYIQMEYCEKTLSEVIAYERLYEAPERLWNLFRQIVSGVAYIHSKGIVHRDLKPKNIFLDFSGDIKIGDLGLARFSQIKGEHEDGEEAHENLVSAASGSLEGDDTSANVGTMLYLAPEVMDSVSSVSDQSKRDVYALGIILFEMWSAFATTMERITSIDRLRRLESFPQGFEAQQVKANRRNVCQLIRWLINAEPTTRPTALQVLDSELLPRTMLESELHQFLSNVQSKPYFHAMLMEALFEREDRAAALFYDPKNALSQYSGSDFALVLSNLTRIFLKHAAQYLRLPLLIPKAGHSALHRAVHVMDAAGAQFYLPYDLTAPFLYFLAHRSSHSAFRRFSFGNVYRARQEGTIREGFETAFDIVCSSSATVEQRAIEDAECVRVLLEILSEFPLEGPGSYIVTISCMDVLDGMMQAAQVPANRRRELHHAILQSSILERGAAGRKKLLHMCKNLDCVERIWEVLNKVWEAQDKGLLAQVKVLNEFLSSSVQGSKAIKDLKMTVELLLAMLPPNIDKIRLFIDPALHLERYRGGIMFNAGVKLMKQKLQIIAAGGRYDETLRSQAADAAGSSSAPNGAVGFCVSLDRLCGCSKISWRPDGTGMTHPTHDKSVNPLCNVLVQSRGSVSPFERLRLMNELWDNGIASQALHADFSAEQLQSFCASRQMDWMVVIESERSGDKSNFGKAKEMKMRVTRCRGSQGPKAEEKSCVGVSELLDFLLDHHSHPPTSSSTPRSTKRSSAGVASSPAERDKAGSEREKIRKSESGDFSHLLQERSQLSVAGVEHGPARLSMHFTDDKKSESMKRKISEAAQRKILSVLKVLGLSSAEVVACASIPFAILAEVFEQSQTSKWQDAIRSIRQKHGRHSEELAHLEELLGNLRSSGFVFLYSSRDDGYVLLPLTGQT